MSQAPTLKNDQIESSPDTSLKSGVRVVLFLIKELVDWEYYNIFGLRSWSDTTKDPWTQRTIDVFLQGRIKRRACKILLKDKL